MGGIKQMISPSDKSESAKTFSGCRSAMGTVSSVNMNTSTEGTVVLKNVPIEFIQQLTVGTNIEIRL